MGNLSASVVKSRVQALIGRGQDMIAGGSLRSKIIRNVGWMAIGFGCEVLVRLISSMILTRLLDPGAYGLISTVMVFMVFVAMLSDLGIKTMVTADERGDDKYFLNVLWTMQVARGFLIGGIVALLSFLWMHALNMHWIPSSSSYANPLLPKLTLLVSVSLVLMGFSSLNEFRLIRHLERGPIAMVDISWRIFTAVVTVALAFVFRSVWAIALGIVLGMALRLALTHLSLAGPRMALSFDWREIGRVMKTSRWVALNSLMTVMSAQADKVLIGIGFGMSTLGIYAVALSLYAGAAAVVDQLNSSLGVPVIRSLLDRTQEERFSAYYRFRLPIDLYCATIGTGMALLGPLFFKLAYDPRYEIGGIYFALLGVKIILMPMHLSGNFLYAQLRYKLASLIGFSRGALLLISMSLALWLQSIYLMVLCIALEQLPEIIAYFSVRQTGIPFRVRRDGVLLGLAILLCGYLLL